MNKRIFLVPLIIFCFGLIIFLKTTFYDFDSYYHLSLACGKTIINNNPSFFSSHFFQYMPCDQNLVKIFIISIFGISTYTIYRIGKIVNEKYAVYAPLVFGLSLTYYTFFARFEDDIIAYPFIFLSLYFLVKHLKKYSEKDYVISLGLSLVGVFFWSGSAIWTIIVLLANPLMLIIGLSCFYFFRDSILNRNPLVSEDTIGVGISSVLLLVIGLINLERALILPFLFATFLAVYKLKYSFFLGLLLGYGTYNYFCKKSFFELDLKTILGFPKNQFVLMLLIIFNLVFITGLYSSSPTPETINLVKYGVLVAGGTVIQNDWPLGHVIRYEGGFPDKEYGPPNNPINTNQGVKIVSQEIPECRELGRATPFILYNCNR